MGKPHEFVACLLSGWTIGAVVVSNLLDKPVAPLNLFCMLGLAIFYQFLFIIDGD